MAVIHIQQYNSYNRVPYQLNEKQTMSELLKNNCKIIEMKT